MARWMLKEAHYLKVPGTVWEEMSVDRDTGRQKRIAHPVPRLLNPKDPSDWSHRPQSGGAHVSVGGSSFDEGAIVVAWAGKTDDRRDFIFEGEPTPDMEPIDDEAKEISAKKFSNWRDPMDSAYTALAPTEQLLIKLQEEMSQAMSTMNQARTPDTGIAETQKQIADTLAQLANAVTLLAKPNEGRRM